MNGWLEEGQSFSGGDWGGTATATPEGAWMQAGSSFAEPLEQPEPVTPPEPAAPDYTSLIDQRIATTQNQLNFVEDAIRYGLETGDFDDSYLERREKLRDQMTRLKFQQRELGQGRQPTPIEGSGLEGEFEDQWGDGGPQFVEDVPSQDRMRYQATLDAWREDEQDSTAPGRVARRVGVGLASFVEKHARALVGDEEGTRRTVLEAGAATQAMAEQGGRVENIVAGAGESIAIAVPAAMVGGLPGVLAAFFGSTYIDSKESAKSKGLSEDEAHAYALTSAGVEAAVTVAFSRAGAGGFESLVTRATGNRARSAAVKAAPGITRMLSGVRDKLPTLLSEIGAETLEENVVSQLQYRLDNATFGGEWSLAEATDIAIDTTASTILAVGAMRTADPKVRAAIGKFVREPSRANAKAVGLEYLGKKEQREKVASTVRSMALREQLHGMVGTTFQTVEEADYIYEMLEARARSADVTLEQYLERTGLEFESAKWEEFVAKKGDAKSTALETMAEPTFDALPPESQAALEGTAVVDDAGKPLPVYHITTTEFDNFDVEQFEGGDYKGIFFDASPKSPTVPSTGDGARTVPAFLNLRNPATSDDKRRIARQLGPDWTPEQMTEAMKAEGFDGVIDTDYTSPHYVAFDQSQVVSALSGETLAEGETGKTKANRAQIEFRQKEGRTVITAFEQADLASMVHELGHLFRRDLAGTDLKAAENWAGVKKGRWSRASEEKFADGFLKWAAEGKGPSEAVTRFFQRFSDYLKGLFDAHRKSRLAPLNLTPEMQQVFGGLLKFDVQQAAMPVETQGPEQQRAPGEPEAYFQINTDPQVQQPQPGVTLAESDNPVTQRFRGLANHAVDESIRQLNYATDVDLGEPSQKTWAEAQAEAARRILQDPDGRAADIDRRIEEAQRTGGTLVMRTMADTAEVALYRNAIAAQAIATNDPKLIAKHALINRAFRESRTEAARTLGFRDPVESPQARARTAIETALTTDPPEVARQRQDARTPEEHAKLDQQLIDHYNGVRERLKGIGIDLSDMDSIVSDPKKAATVIQAVKPREHGFWDMLFEYWRNSILSGITTHGVNTASNIGFVALNFAERLGEATFNAAYSVTGAKQPKIKSATFGEVGHLLAALNTTTLSKAISNAMMAWRTEMPQLEASLGREGTVKIDGPLFAIAGDPTTTKGQALNKAGRLIRMMGYRPLLFMDELAKTVSSHMEAAAFAYRIAKAEAARNPSVDVNARIQQLLENTDSDAWTLALDKAQTLAFQGQKGIVAGGVSKVISGIRQAPGGRWIVPFRDTPAAVFEEGIRRMPVIGFLLDYAEQRRNKKTIGEIDFAPILARQAIALAMMGLIEGMLADDDEPFITGTRDMADQKQRDLAYRTFQPMSVRVPFTDMRISYARFEPMATALAWTVDTVQAYKQGAKQGGVADGMASATGEAATAMLRQIGTKTFLDTVGDLMEAFQDAQRHNRMERGLSWGAKQLASFVPNIYRSSIRGNDITQNKVWGKGEQWGQMLLKRTAQNALGSPAGFPPTPRYDIWGRQITFNSPNAGVLMRALSVTGTKTRLAEDVEEIDRALYVWNVRHPQQAISWSEPQHYIRVDKETHYLTDDEYTEYSRRAGEYALTNAKKIRINVGDPTLKQIENIGAAVQRGQQRARNELKPLWLKRIRDEQTPTAAR